MLALDVTGVLDISIRLLAIVFVILGDLNIGIGCNWCIGRNYSFTGYLVF